MNPIVYIIFVAAVFTFQMTWMKKQHKQMKEEKENARSESAADFRTVKTDLKQHLKDDGFIQPQPGSEEHYQRWKTEREKKEP